MKLLFIISTLYGGGAERTMSNITMHLPKNVEADILVNSVSAYDFPTNARIINMGMKPGQRMGVIYQVIANIKRVRKARKLKRENNYDACISFMDSANIANIVSGKKHCKVILSEHINLSGCDSAEYHYIVFPLAKPLYKRADHMICVSKGVEDDLIKNFNLTKNQTSTIYNGCDIEETQKLARESSNIEIDSKNFYFLTSGRLCEQKGQWHLVKAFSEVVKKHPESRLILCGEGEHLPMLKQIAEANGVIDKVIFAGFQKNPFAIASQCDVFVLPSMYEGFGNVIIENMVCGLPIIATDFRSGAREILAPNTDYNFQQSDTVEYAEYGIITPVCSGKKDSKDLEKEELLLAQAMIRLIEDSALKQKYISKSLERANHFGNEDLAGKWFDLISDIVKKNDINEV